MIVLPRLLVDLLDHVDRARGAHLALDFAEHVLDLEREEIGEPVSAACREFIAAAHEVIDLGEGHPRLFTAQERLLEAAARWEGNRHVLAPGAGLVLDAARVGTQRMMEKEAGHQPGSLLRCLDVAHKCQAEAGRWHAQRCSDDADERLAARHARWEEARWQTQHIIATDRLLAAHRDGSHQDPSDRVVIVLPVLLAELLTKVSQQRAVTLSLDFAERAVELQAALLTPDMREACAEYVAAAREAVRLGRADDRLVRAHDVFFETGWRTPGHSDVTHVLEAAVRLACQDMLIEAGAMNRAGRTNPTPQYIAKTAQSGVGRWYAERAGEGEDRREVNRRARWEEARWQVQHLVATEPQCSN